LATTRRWSAWRRGGCFCSSVSSLGREWDASGARCGVQLAAGISSAPDNAAMWHNAQCIRACMRTMAVCDIAGYGQLTICSPARLDSIERMSAMAEQVKFAVQRRTALGKAASKLRRQGIIPGNIYGGGRESIAIQFNGLEFQRFLAKHPATTLLRLTLGEGARDETVVVRHVEREPATRAIQHVDFLHVELSQAIRARLPLHLTGDAPAVKLDAGGLLT